MAFGEPRYKCNLCGFVTSDSHAERSHACWLKSKQGIKEEIGMSKSRELLEELLSVAQFYICTIETAAGFDCVAWKGRVESMLKGPSDESSWIAVGVRLPALSFPVLAQVTDLALNKTFQQVVQLTLAGWCDTRVETALPHSWLVTRWKELPV